MTVLGVLGSKGGCGASLVATNLAVSLTQEGKTLLVDLHLELAYDDLLLDLTPIRSWADLMPVAQELTDHHLDLAFVTHSSGLKLLAAPEEHKAIGTPELLPNLLQGLGNRFDWVVVDLPSGLPSPMDQVIDQIELLLLVSTGDLPSIRNSKRTLKRLPPGLRRKTYLVMNQIGRGHPLEPQRIANALDLILIATLPPDSHAVGYHVSYGTPSIFDSRSHFGRGIVELGQRVVGLLAGDQLGDLGDDQNETDQNNLQERKA